MVNQMNLIWVSAMSIYAECHSAIMHDFMNGTSRRCVHLLQFQEFVFAGFSAQWWVHFLLSTWKTKRFEENQVNKMSECYIYIHPNLNAIEASSTICERSSFLIPSSVSNSCDLVHLNIWMWKSKFSLSPFKHFLPLTFFSERVWFWNCLELHLLVLYG